MEADFSGYATKAGLECSDGRTIMPNAFKHQDTMTVPLVWSHIHSDPENVLGKAVLEHRADGIYTYAYFNDSPKAKTAKTLVQHGDVVSMSIYANKLVEKAKQVLHGSIKEVSLVLAGANPGALIDNVSLAHGDDLEVLDEEAVIYTGLSLEHEDKPSSGSGSSNSNEDDETVQDVYDTLSDKQRELVHYMIGEAIASTDGADNSVEHSDDAADDDKSEEESDDNKSDDENKADDESEDESEDKSDEDKSEDNESDDDNEDSLNHKEGSEMTRNVFEQAGNSTKEARPELTHSQLATIVDDAPRLGSLKESFLAHAQEYGIEDVDVLFPDATLDSNGVTLISRRMEWVNNVLTKTRHSPFSRIKSVSADITADEARARGYVKGSLKKDEVVKMLKRVTTPKTVYKKQKLDRDDIVDITTVDIVAWLKGEMRLMLDEEIARAVLVGDNRAADDDDKIDEDSIRPVAYDVDMYNTTVNLPVDISPNDLVDAVITALDGYKGSGTPTLYTTQRRLTSMLLTKDTLGRRFYATKADLAAALLVDDIVPVEAMEQDSDLVGVIVNLQDYTIGADAGGAVAMFDDFDIDYNQQKYLIETRISGALTKPKSAITLKINSGRIVTPTAPTFNATTGVVTIPSVTGVVYTNQATGTTLASGAQTAVAPGASIDVEAVPASGYGFSHDSNAEWAFTRNAS